MKTEEYTDELDYGFVLNKIYDKKGFQGIIEYVKDELEYGNVTIEHGVYCITTGGWSEDEFLIHSLISPVSKFHYHYCGYLVGGAFYFVEDKEKMDNIEIIDMNRFEDKLLKSLDTKIKKGEKAIAWGESRNIDVGAMSFYIEMLKLLQKELEE